MTARWITASRTVEAQGPEPDQASVLQRAEGVENAAPPFETGQIAAWVNEGGAGGEVKK
jgi:hypothetical protein